MGFRLLCLLVVWSGYHGGIASRRGEKTGQYEKSPRARLIARSRRVLLQKVISGYLHNKHGQVLQLASIFLCSLVVWSDNHGGMYPGWAAKTGQP